MGSIRSVVIVTASTHATPLSERCLYSWGSSPVHLVTGQYGVVPAFRQGVDDALQQYPQAEILACLHDDLEIHDPHWAERVAGYFAENPRMGLAGFGGAIGLGSDDLYQTEYRPEQLARIGFRSNLVDAEVHGVRSLLPERVACLDGFSLIGRREFWAGVQSPYGDPSLQPARPWAMLARLGMIHHFYDSALGALAARYGWETWYLPIACRHYGGQTAVGDPNYQRWAQQQRPGGDHDFWEEAHRIGHDVFRDVLPIRI